MTHCKSEEKEAQNLGNKQFRKAFKKLLENKKNHKKTDSLDWAHKSLCFYHEIYPVAKNYYKENEIPESQFRICSCNKFRKKIKNLEAQFRIGLNELLDGIYKYKNAHFTDLDINIDSHRHCIQLLQMKAGEIKKTTQPGTRKKILGTATFYDATFIIQIKEHYFMRWRLKTRYTNKQIDVNPNVTAKDTAEWWYQNWSVHGIREEKNHNLNTKQFVGIHNNPFIQGTSLEKCYKRIVIDIYSTKNIKMLQINGKIQKSMDNIRENGQLVSHKNNNKMSEEDEDDDILYSELSQITSQSQSSSASSQSQASYLNDMVIKKEMSSLSGKSSNTSMTIKRDNHNNHHYKHGHNNNNDENHAYKLDSDLIRNLREKIENLEKKLIDKERENMKLKKQNHDLSARVKELTDPNYLGLPTLHGNTVDFTPPDLYKINEPSPKKQKLNNGQCRKKSINMQNCYTFS